jgi:hypothetical protein
MRKVFNVVIKKNKNYLFLITNNRMSNICNDLKVIPQFEGTCWFNAFLMSVLYSQYARKMMIKVSKTWDKKDNFLNILKYILKKNYNDPSIATYYNKIQPEILLFKFLKNYDKEKEHLFKNRIRKDISRFGWTQLYFPYFLKSLDNKTIDIYYDKNKDDYIIDFYKNLKIQLNEKSTIISSYTYNKININKEKKEILQSIKDIPNFIILFHSELSQSTVIPNGFNSLKKYNKNEGEVFDLNSYNIKVNGIKEYKDVITFNGIKYKLDSCIISNFDTISNKNHVICGITCNENRYVYNGWTRKTEDPAMKKNEDIVKEGNYFPCSLMKFDWDLRKNKEFCLNPIQCKLDFVIDKNDLCFSFNKGDRILLYVRIDEDIKTTNITTLNSSKIKLSNIKLLLKDFYQIDKLNEEELKNHLLYFAKSEFIKKNHKEVDKYIYDYLYGKTIEDLKQILSEKINSNKDIPKNKKSVDIYNLKYLNIEELKKYLRYYIIVEYNENTNERKEIFFNNYFKGHSIEDLRKMLFEKIINKYNISKSEIKNKDYISRKNIYTKYKSFKNFKGKLLKQQVFLEDFINDNYDLIDKMLIFHGIGTGKTCTSITIAESIMKKNNKMKVLVILPARLKTNFIDELISENCGMNKYISKNDFMDYINIKTSIKEKNKIRKNFIKKINNNYEIISYETLRNRLMKSNDIKDTINEITKNRIVIIDEIHNLITTRINNKTLDSILKNNKIPTKTKMINGVIMRLMTLLANKTSKFFLLTATPVFDNYGQFIELVLNLRPDIKENELKRNIDDLNFLVEKIRGKVSFYKLNDMSDYPKSIIDNIEIPLSKTQDLLIGNTASYDNEFSNLFCITERQISISTYGLNNKEKVFSNLNEYAPKLKKLFELLELNGKHVIYSNFINYCLYLIAYYLKKNGWNNFIEDGIKKNKTFVIWDASLNDDNKQEVKNILNSISNIDGSNIKVILGSPSIKEGISFKHIQHLHQIDPVWNSSAKTQIEGRCIRYKSHEEIPLNHPTLKREVVIHNYISVARNKGLVNRTCDSKIYFDIIKKKAKIISLIEKLLMKVSIDYYLWNDDNKSPTNLSSNISLSKEKNELFGILDNKKIREKKKININGNNCPVMRRPIENKCSNKTYPFIRKNAKGFDCCYKKDKK